jgi:hypothetical protein
MLNKTTRHIKFLIHLPPPKQILHTQTLRDQTQAMLVLFQPESSDQDQEYLFTTVALLRVFLKFATD